MNLKIHYLDHSGFVVETANSLLVFDYLKGTLPSGDKPVYVFCSHSHSDHYNPAVLNWSAQRDNVKYIFSSDILAELPPAAITLLSPYDELKLDDLFIRAFGSTDAGVSFWVDYAGAGIFHAGDLNWWHWSGDTPENLALAEKSFKSEIDRLKGLPIDLAFFPVDPRLEQYAYLGAEYFIREVNPRFLIPMHFWQNSQFIENFASKLQNSSTKVLALTKRQQSISL